VRTTENHKLNVWGKMQKCLTLRKLDRVVNTKLDRSKRWENCTTRYTKTEPRYENWCPLVTEQIFNNTAVRRPNRVWITTCLSGREIWSGKRTLVVFHVCWHNDIIVFVIHKLLEYIKRSYTNVAYTPLKIVLEFLLKTKQYDLLSHTIPVMYLLTCQKLVSLTIHLRKYANIQVSFNCWE
jgi:hypothetical protein